MTMTTQQNWIDRAHQVLPAGGFGNFAADTIIREGKGARVWDEDGNEYIDFLIGSGPMLVGHSHPEVVDAVQEQIGKGMTFFANNSRGIELAEVICDAVECAEQIRFVSTGGEADMYAMRLARAVTGRDKILKFEGGYHGMSAESLMSLAPTVVQDVPSPVPDSAGIPASVQDHMIIAPFNDAQYVQNVFAQHGHEIACVIAEPLQRLIPPKPGFLELLRSETTKAGALLIFDEVVTGFRLSYGGAQEKYGVTPDICTLGKIIGGGFPLAAIGGRAQYMAHFDREKSGDAGFLYQIGTLSGNPVAAVAGLKTMEILKRPGAYEKLRSNGKVIIDAIHEHLGAAGVEHQVVGDETLFDIVYTDRSVHDYRDTLRSPEAHVTNFNRVLRDKGILKSPAKMYPSLALTDADLDQTVSAIADAAKAL